MYAITMPRCTIGYTLREFMQNFSLNWKELKKILPGICLHSGRTDANGGHRDWLNRTGWGFGAYHYHHKLPAHLHQNGKCPYGNKKSSRIINPYTGKNIDIGVPYIFENDQFYSLDLVIKSLTADDDQNIILKEDEAGGVFVVCSTGDSTMENPGTVIFFDYSNFLGFLDNRVFETLNGNLRLLASSDGDSTKIYISLETIRDYMTKDGYFTDFSDNGSGVWSFKVRKPIVHNIVVLRNGNSFNVANEVANVGDEITVQANIEKVASARLIVVKVGPMEYKDNFDNQSSVTFSKFKLTEEEIGRAAIESGSLTISVNGHTGGTALDAEIDARMLGDSVSIRIEKSEGLEKGREVFIPHTVSGTLNGADKTLYPIDNWGAPGNGNYPQGVQKDSNDRYIVAVGPKIVNPNYPDNGKIWSEDFDSFNKRIDVVLEHKTIGVIKTIECVVGDYKAHSYNKYLDGHAYNTGDTASFNVENGLLQTGIAYPNSWNAGQNLACAPNHMNGTVIEFCGHQVDFDYENYKLVKLIVLDK